MPVLSSEKVGFFHRGESLFIAIDDVIQELNSHHFAGFVKPSGELNIFPAGNWILARVIMRNQDASGREQNWNSVDFPWMNQACVQTPYAHQIDGLYYISGVQDEGVEMLPFLSIVDGVKELDGINGSGDGDFLYGWFFSYNLDAQPLEIVEIGIILVVVEGDLELCAHCCLLKRHSEKSASAVRIVR